MQQKTSEELNQEIQNDIANLYSKIRQLEALLEMSSPPLSLLDNWDKEMALLQQGGGVCSGIASIDDFFYRFKPGQLIIIGARTSVGKTALALSMIANMIVQEKKVLLFSLEMSKTENINRLASILTGISLYDFMNNKIETTDTRLNNFRKLLDAGNLFIEVSCKPELIRSKISEYKRKHDIDVVFIDYIGKLANKIKGNLPIYEKTTQISGEIKDIAMELLIPIFALAQFNRSQEKENRKPQLSDLRDSGAIEQDADIILFPYRYKEKDANDNEILGSRAEILVKKHRSGKTGTIPNIQFEKSIARYSESNEQQQEREVLPENIKKQPQQTHFQETEKECDADGNVIF